MSEYKGKIKIAGKVYDCEVVDGVAYVNGMKAEEFVDQLPFDERMKFAMVGAVAVDAERSGIKVSPVQVYKSLDEKPN